MALFLCVPAFAAAYTAPDPETGAIIKQTAAEYGVDPNLALAIAWCESRFNDQAKHWNSNGTKDVGLYQINDVHIARLQNLGLTRYDASENTEYAMKLLSAHGTRDFSSSRGCWGPIYASL